MGSGVRREDRVRFGRLLSMSLPELTGRCRQELSRQLDRVQSERRGGEELAAIFHRLSPGLADVGARSRAGDVAAAARTLRDRFCDTVPSRFFPGSTSDDMAALLGRRFARERENLISTADAVCGGRFDLLGYRGLGFGDPIDWHLDPVSGRRAPSVHWSRLDPLECSVVGDSKVVWELNRHQWFVTLGQAYRLTGNERYAEVFACLVREWLGANPRGRGINWTSSLELALRLISWCWALALFRGSPSLSPELFVAMLSSLWGHARHVERHLSYYFSPNTHLTGEALGLFYAGVVFPELRDAERWRRLGARILVQELERQVLPDGVYFEQSTCYQRYTLDIYLHFWSLARQADVPVPPLVGESIGRMLDFLLAIRHGDGSLPQIGDADGGRLLPLGPRTPDDTRDVFSTAAIVLGRADCAWAAGQLALETLWLLGPTSDRMFENLQPSSPRSAPSRHFAAGGYVVMRSGWHRQAHQLVLDVGPLGCSVSAGHGHADLLSIQCAAFGRPHVVDPGTYVYAGEPGWREHFRGTGAHSTVTVDGEDQAVTTGPFRWGARPAARLRHWRSTPLLDFADASHGAYRRLDDPVTHRRRVLFVKPRYWVVVDDLAGAAEHAIAVLFQFAPMEVSIEPDLWVRVSAGEAAGGLLVRSFASVPLKCELREGEQSPIQGWVSRDYGVRDPAPVLICSAVGRLPMRIATVLWPVGDPGLAPPAVSPLMGLGLAPCGLIVGTEGEIVRFAEPEFVLERR